MWEYDWCWVCFYLPTAHAHLRGISGSRDHLGHWCQSHGGSYGHCQSQVARAEVSTNRSAVCWQEEVKILPSVSRRGRNSSTLLAYMQDTSCVSPPLHAKDLYASYHFKQPPPRKSWWTHKTYPRPSPLPVWPWLGKRLEKVSRRLVFKLHNERSILLGGPSNYISAGLNKQKKKQVQN